MSENPPSALSQELADHMTVVRAQSLVLACWVAAWECSAGRVWLVVFLASWCFFPLLCLWAGNRKAKP